MALAQAQKVEEIGVFEDLGGGGVSAQQHRYLGASNFGALKGFAFDWVARFCVQAVGRFRDDLAHGCTLPVCCAPSLVLMEEVRVAIPKSPLSAIVFMRACLCVGIL
jgi:hypothetical protein